MKNACFTHSPDLYHKSLIGLFITDSITFPLNFMPYWYLTIWYWDLSYIFRATITKDESAINRPNWQKVFTKTTTILFALMSLVMASIAVLASDKDDVSGFYKTCYAQQIICVLLYLTNLAVGIFVFQVFSNLTVGSVYTIDMSFSAKIAACLIVLFLEQVVLLVTVDFANGTRDVLLILMFCTSLCCEAFFGYLVYKMVSTGEYLILKVLTTGDSLDRISALSYRETDRPTSYHIKGHVLDTSNSLTNIVVE